MQNASIEDIYTHLVECNSSFVPPLFEVVDISEYSKKIFQKSVTFEAWNKSFLIGLLAAYFNKDTNSVYITNVSVLKKFRTLGIASQLILLCINKAIDSKMNKISLEVGFNNNSAISFYKKFDFVEQKTNNDKMLMKRLL